MLDELEIGAEVELGAYEKVEAVCVDLPWRCESPQEVDLLVECENLQTTERESPEDFDLSVRFEMPHFGRLPFEE